MNTRKNYALKIVPKSGLLKKKARQKFQSEIRIHRSLSNENVVTFHQYFEDEDNCYILLELCHNNVLIIMILISNDLINNIMF